MFVFAGFLIETRCPGGRMVKCLIKQTKIKRMIDVTLLLFIFLAIKKQKNKKKQVHSADSVRVGAQFGLRHRLDGYGSLLQANGWLFSFLQP